MVKHSKLFLIGLAVLGSCVLAWQGSSAAQSFRSGDNTSVAATERIDSSLYASGRTIDVAGRVDGDIFCAGQNITISGEVTGDVICAGQNVHVTGKVGGNVRLAGQSVTLGGQITRSASIATQSFVSEGTSRVGQDISIFAQDATLNGTIGRDLSFNGRQLTLNNEIGRDTQSNAGQVTRLGTDARIKGDLTYRSSDELQRANGAVVNDEISRAAMQRPDSGSGRGGLALLGAYLLVAMLVIALALVLLMPRLFQDASNQILLRPGKAVLTGFILGLAMPALISLLLFTVIGIPLAVLVTLVWLVALILSGPTAAYTLGRLLLRNSRNAIVIMLVGGLVLLLLYLVPVVNVIAVMAVLWFGLGGLALTAPRLRRPGYHVQSAHAVLAKRQQEQTSRHDEE